MYRSFKALGAATAATGLLLASSIPAFAQDAEVTVVHAVPDASVDVYADATPSWRASNREPSPTPSRCPRKWT